MARLPEPLLQKMKGRLPFNTLMAFDQLSQCLEEWERLVPIPSHVDLRTSWKDTLCEYIESIDQDELVASISTGLINAYSEWSSDDYSDAVEHEKTFALMQRPQTTQRTADWYTEFKRCLTASELYKIFGSVRERGMLILQKSGKLELPGRGSNLAVLRQFMSPFDWGICFEPVVKLILENHWEAIIHEVGRFVHLVDTRLAASPDGLIIRSLKHPDMGGHLLEIKCPKSRVIGLKVPMEYFYQMQLQLEVTGVRACEYVEAKFEFVDSLEKPDGFHGKIAVIGCLNEQVSEWLPSKYIYGPLNDLNWIPDLGLNERVLETNIWRCVGFHHERVYRDEAWFESLKPTIDEFWLDVERARAGDFVLPESSRKKKAVACMIQDDSEPEENLTIE